MSTALNVASSVSSTASRTSTTNVDFEGLIAGNFAALLAMTGALYQAGGYHGQVDLGIAVTGLRGGYSGTRQDGFFEDHRGYGADDYLRHDRVAAAALAEPEDVVRALLRHLVEATTGREGFDPFA